MLNATPLVKGGALQACVSFILQALQNSEDVQWSFVISKEVMEELESFEIDVERPEITVITPSPAKSKLTRKKLLDITNEIAPDVVFTFFGPAYVDFKRPHLMGVADGWVTHSTKLALKKKGGFLSLLRLLFLFFYKKYWYKQANYWVVEAECAKQGILNRFNIHEDKISIVPNNCSDLYRQNRIEFAMKETENKILVLSAYYKHKNLEIIPYVASELKSRMRDGGFRFILTLRKGSKEEVKILSKAHELGVGETIENIGPVAVRHAPSLYKDAKISFMPTLLETFSAVYPESMMSGKPIVTSDLSFAHDICGSAALYFNPIDPTDAANQIEKLLCDSAIYDDLVQKGYEVVDKLPTQYEKYIKYEKILTGLTH